MVDKKITQGVEDMATVYKTLCLDLPLAEAQRGLGIGGERETLDMAWKGYDAGMRLATTAIDDNFYRTPLFGEVMARSLDSALRWQRLSNALVGAFFTALWQAVGLPTAAEIQALQAEAQALRAELRSLATGLPARSTERKAVTELDARRSKLLRVKKMQENGAVNQTLAAA